MRTILTPFINAGTLLFLSLFFLSACDNNTSPEELSKPIPSTEVTISEDVNDTIQDETGTNNRPGDSQYNIGNKQYLFVVDQHSTEELEALLIRADEIASTSLDLFNELEIAMVIHGPSIDLFREKNYPENKKMIDLAAKLDAFKVLDIKICETSMNRFDVQRSEVPEFIDSVPFAPDEIEKLSADGYINL